MSMEANAARAGQVLTEVLSTGNLALLDDVVAPNVVRHDLGGRPDIVGLQGIKLFVTAIRTAFPDIELTIEDVIAEGDKVVVRYTARGTHKGVFQGIAATGRQVSWAGINIYRHEGSKAVETWQLASTLAVIQQLGVVTPSADAGA
jgi:predicted ester cyclase